MLKIMKKKRYREKIIRVFNLYEGTRDIINVRGAGRKGVLEEIATIMLALLEQDQTGQVNGLFV